MNDDLLLFRGLTAKHPDELALLLQGPAGDVEVSEIDPDEDARARLCCSSFVNAEAALVGQPPERVADSLRNAMSRHLDAPEPARQHWTGNNGRVFRTRGLALQQRYTNSSQGFFEDYRTGRKQHIRSNAHRQLQAKKLFEWALDFEVYKPEAGPAVYNPLYSASRSLDHAVRYALGLKNYFELQPTRPEYDARGVPRHPVIGLVLVFEVSPADRAALHAKDEGCTLQELDERGEIDVGPRIVTEAEVTFYGSIPSRFLRKVYVIRSPDLQHRAFHAWREVFRRLPHDDVDRKAKAETELLKSRRQPIIDFISDDLRRARV